ncbi:MAG: polyphosphate kinase 2 family protein [Planctomycetaceae bacterium]
MHPDLSRIIKKFRVPAGKRCRLKDYDAGWDGDDSIPKEERKRQAEKILTQDVTDLSAAQERLYASDSWSMLLIFQAMDAAGKDGTIKHVMSGVNPQGCQVHSFKQPSSEELDHNFLWRCSKALPERGRIGIFNRSHYEEVLVVKVHPEYLAGQRLPQGDPDKNDFWKRRYEDINNFEKHLADNGTLILKFFLNVSKKEQKKRFLERIDETDKHWKFSSADVKERAYWKQYMEAYEEALSETSTDWAPWYVIPADNKWVTRAVVAALITDAIESLNLKFPEMTPNKLAELEEARKLLDSE